MRSLCLIAISLLGLAACSPPFSTVGFQKKIDIPLNNGRVATALGLGDLDGDHDQDILITSNQNELIALISKGDGSFATGVSYPLDTIGNQNARTIAVGDLTGDGLADVVVGNTEQSTISLFLNADGGRLMANSPSINVGCQPIRMQLFDINEDGRIDLIIACQNPNEIRISRNQGSSTSALFSAPYTHSYSITADQGQIPVIRAMSIGNLDSDNQPDIAIGTDIGLRIINSPKPNQSSSNDYVISVPVVGRISALSTGDITGDRSIDVSAIVDGQAVQVFSYEGFGSYNKHSIYKNLATPGRSPTYNLVSADISNDGRTDLLMLFSNPSEIKSIISQGESGTVEAPSFLSYSYSSGLDICDGCLSAGDISGDGKPDLVLRNNNQISVLLNSAL